MVSLNYTTSIAHHNSMGWASCAKGHVTAVSQYCRAHQTVCPTNTSRSDRIGLGPNYPLDRGGGEWAT